MAAVYGLAVAAQGWIGQTAAAMIAAPETDAARRKRLLWRATHRGIKEMDIIFGSFVAARIEAFTETELDELDRMIGLPDQELLSWATGTEVIPSAADSPLLRAMLGLGRA